METHTQAYKTIFALFFLHCDVPLYITRAKRPLFVILHTELVLVNICCRYKPNISNFIILFHQKSYIFVFRSKIHRNEEIFQMKILCGNDT
jgi:hypothetical protein